MRIKKIYKSLYYFKIFIILILFLINPVSLFADAGLPMIFISYPVMITALLPVIIIESAVFVKTLNINYKKSVVSNGIANAVSTLAGFPLAWGFLFLLEMVTTDFRCGPGFDTIQNSIITVIVEAAWLCPAESHFYWLIPAAFIINLFIAFIISLVIEYFINSLFYKGYDKKIIRKAVVVSNAFSYGFLLILSFGYLIFSIIDH